MRNCKSYPPVHIRLWSAALCCLLLQNPAVALAEQGKSASATAQGTPDTTGVVLGSVSNQATGAFLDGARIVVEGTNQEVFTEGHGAFRLTLPPGTALLRVDYTGLNPQTLSVNVVAGSTTRQDIELTSDVYQLEQFVVSSPREGAAAAIMRQKQAPNVKNIVAADDFGNVASGNVGEILQLIPGVAAQWNGADILSVQIRGINPELNSVTVNGQATAQDQSGGLSRTYEFYTTSLAGVESIEVTKAPTPDMPGNSLGGSINLVSRSAFDRAGGRVVDYSIGGTYRTKYRTPTTNRLRQPINGIGPALNFSYSDIYSVFGGKKNLGLTVSASVYDQPGGDTSSIVDYSQNVTGPAFIYQLRSPRPSQVDVFRTAVSGKADYKLGEHTVASLAANYVWYYQFSDVRTNTITAAPSAAELANPTLAFATLDANGKRIGGGYLNPNLSESYTEWFQKAGAGSTLAASQTNRVSASYQIQPSIVHKFPGLTIDYGATYSYSITWFYFGPEHRHYGMSNTGDVTGSVTTPRLSNIGFKVDRRNTGLNAWPEFTQTAGPDIYNLNNYSGAGAMTYTDSTRAGYDEIAGAHFNAKKDFNLPVPASIKAGFDYNRDNRRTWSHAKSYTFLGNDGVAGNVEDNLGQFLDKSGSITTDYFNGWKPAAYPDPTLVARDVFSHPERWRLDTAGAATSAFNGRRIGNEALTSAYVMGSAKIGKLSVLSGVRFEKTEDDAEGPLTVSGVKKTVARSGNYHDLFPSVHLKYNYSPNLQARASWSTSIGRPSFSDIIPLDTVNETTNVITASNPNLRPQHSDNFDLGVEYYFEPVGKLSAGYFWKEITDFIFSQNSLVGPGSDYYPLYNGYTITTKQNGGAARYRGFELSYSEQFTFLPGSWSGLGVNANYTQIETRGDYGGTVQTTQLARFVPKYASVGLSYIKNRFNLRLNSVWQSSYFNGVNANPALLQYSKSRFTMNFKSEFRLDKNLRLFVDIDNLNAAPVAEFYYYTPEHMNQERIASPRITFGLKGRF